jgi:hypothetical protein
MVYLLRCITRRTVKAFLEDLRTQHIYRIAAGYMVSSWLILQISSLLCSVLGLPNWTLKTILALLLVGFGAALIIGSRLDLRAATNGRRRSKKLSAGKSSGVGSDDFVRSGGQTVRMVNLCLFS